MYDFYAQFIGPGTLCFDVGANVGNRVRVFLRLQADVVAVEPQGDCARALRAAFGKNRHLMIVQKALGEAEGQAEMMISSAHTISSLSPAWVEAVKRSGRFSDFTWDRRKVVPVTTLDALIAQYGVPTFIKIDVEGFDYPVIKGLSRPVPALSLEFVPEYIESTFNCIDHLRRLGRIRLNYAVGETMRLALERWVTPEAMVDVLWGFRDDHRLFGDVYVQFVPEG